MFTCACRREGGSGGLDKPPDLNSVEEDLERIFGPGASKIDIVNNKEQVTQVPQDIPTESMENDPPDSGTSSQWKIVRGKKRNKTQSEGQGEGVSSDLKDKSEELDSVDGDVISDLKDGEVPISTSGEVSSGFNDNFDEMENKKLKMMEGEVYDSNSVSLQDQ